MAKKKNNPNIRVKSIEVSSQSFFGKSEMDKTLEKYQNEGWTLVRQQKVKSNRYLLSFEYELDAEEIAKEKKKERNGRLGCLVLLFACACFYFIPNSNRNGSSNSNNSRSESTRVVQVSSIPERTSVTVRDTAVSPNTSIPDTSIPDENTAVGQFATNTSVPAAQAAVNISTDQAPTVNPVPMTLTSQVLTATALFVPSYTPAPTNTPRPAQVETDTYYITASTANVRECSNSTTTCNILTALSYGDDIEVIERVEGISVAGSTRWYRVLLNDGREGYVHSSLVSRTRPVAGNSGGGSSGSGNNAGGSSNNNGGSSTGSSNPQPTAAPQVQPTQPPAPVSQYTCDCNKTCGSMTCDEAYFQLNTCGCQARDNDNDGVPCESVCSGG